MIGYKKNMKINVNNNCCNKNKIEYIYDFFCKEMDFNENLIINISNKTFKEIGNNVGASVSIIPTIVNNIPTFDLWISKTLLVLPPITFLKTIFHEFLHIFQYFKKNLRFDKASKKFHYGDKVYDESIQYEKSPWEIHANFYEKQLTKKYLSLLIT